MCRKKQKEVTQKTHRSGLFAVNSFDSMEILKHHAIRFIRLTGEGQRWENPILIFISEILVKKFCFSAQSSKRGA